MIYETIEQAQPEFNAILDTHCKDALGRELP